MQIEVFKIFGLGKVRHGLQSLFKHFEECKGFFGRAKVAIKHIVEHFQKTDTEAAAVQKGELLRYSRIGKLVVVDGGQWTVDGRR